MTVDEARQHIGDDVVYEREHCERETGVITSVSEAGVVFVRYQRQHPSADGQGTWPSDLRLVGVPG